MIVIILCIGVNLNIVLLSSSVVALSHFSVSLWKVPPVADHREDALNLLISLSIHVRLLSLVLFLCCQWCVLVAQLKHLHTLSL